MTREIDQPVLEARGVLATLTGGRCIQASFSLHSARILQVTGPSGSGKTTLLRILARLDSQQKGEILLGGRPAAAIRPMHWRRQVVYLAQKPVMFDGTVRHNLEAVFTTSQALQAMQTTKQKEIREAEARQILEALRLNPQLLMDQEARTLSVGEAARVALCRALLVRPAVLLADEITAALDPEASGALVNLVASQTKAGLAVVMVAHDDAAWTGVKRELLGLDGEKHHSSETGRDP